MIVIVESCRTITNSFEIEKKVFGYDWVITGENPVSVNGVLYSSGSSRMSGMCVAGMILKMKLAFVFDLPSEVILNYFVHE